VFLFFARQPEPPPGNREAGKNFLGGFMKISKHVTLRFDQGPHRRAYGEIRYKQAYSTYLLRDNAFLQRRHDAENSAAGRIVCSGIANVPFRSLPRLAAVEFKRRPHIKHWYFSVDKNGNLWGGDQYPIHYTMMK